MITPGQTIDSPGTLGHEEGLLSHVETSETGVEGVMDRYRARANDFRDGPFPTSTRVPGRVVDHSMLGTTALRPHIIRSSPSKMNALSRMSPQKYAALSLPQQTYARPDPAALRASSGDLRTNTQVSPKRKLASAPPEGTGKKPRRSESKKKGGSRFDSSLALLTRKFLDLVQSSPTGIVDLNQGANELGVQKRRIYDITNVMEGVGLIEKKSKNNIQWTGAGGAAEADAKTILQLKTKLTGLSEVESRIDEQILQCSTRLKELAEDTANIELAFVTHDDLATLACFSEQTLIAIKAPAGTKLEVPHPEEAEAEKQYQIFLGSPSDPIDIYLIHTPHPMGPGVAAHDPPLQDNSCGTALTQDWSYAHGASADQLSGPGSSVGGFEDFYLPGGFDDPGMAALWSDGEDVAGYPEFGFQT